MRKVDLDLWNKRSKDWTTKTVVSRTYPPSFSHKERKKHGGIKPPELMYELLKAYGSNSISIIDPFAGVGSSLLASSLLNKIATGIEINPIWQDVYYKVCEENGIGKQKWIVGDSQKVLENFKGASFDFVLTDIPYFSMDKLKQTRGKFSKAGEESKKKLKTSLKIFNDDPVPTKKEWETLIKNVFKLLYKILEDNSTLVIFIGNMYRNFKLEHNNSLKSIGQYFLLSYEIAEILIEIGFNQINELVWMDTGKKLGIYGYPYTWVPSLVDQRILIFKK